MVFQYLRWHYKQEGNQLFIWLDIDRTRLATLPTAALMILEALYNPSHSMSLQKQGEQSTYCSLVWKYSWFSVIQDDAITALWLYPACSALQAPAHRSWLWSWARRHKHSSPPLFLNSQNHMKQLGEGMAHAKWVITDELERLRKE